MYWYRFRLTAEKFQVRCPVPTTRDGYRVVMNPHWQSFKVWFQWPHKMDIANKNILRSRYRSAEKFQVRCPVPTTRDGYRVVMNPHWQSFKYIYFYVWFQWPHKMDIGPTKIYYARVINSPTDLNNLYCLIISMFKRSYADNSSGGVLSRT